MINKSANPPDSRGPSVPAFVFLLLAAIAFIIPLLWVFFTSFKVDMEVYQADGFILFPRTWTLENYQEILNPRNTQFPVYRWLSNSLFYSCAHTVIALLIYSLSAYAYAKLDFKGRNGIFYTVLFLASFPPVINIIPLYKINLELGWLNTPMAVITYGLAGLFNIFLIRQFMMGIPDSLLESARLDGAGELRIYATIILPLIKPVLIAVALFCFTANWNEFLWPSVAMNNIDKLTLTAGLQLAKNVYGTQAAKMSAAAMVAIMPMIVLYLFTQKYLINGVSLSSGVKG